METNVENMKRPRFWLQLPIVIGGFALEAFKHDMDVLLDRVATPPELGTPPAHITYIEHEPEDIVA